MLSTGWRWETDLRNPSVFGEGSGGPWGDGWIPQHNDIRYKQQHIDIDYSKRVYFGLGLYVLKSVLSKELNFKKKDGG